MNQDKTVEEYASLLLNIFIYTINCSKQGWCFITANYVVLAHGIPYIIWL